MAKLRGINALYVRFFFRLPLELLVPKRERGEGETEREGDRERGRQRGRQRDGEGRGSRICILSSPILCLFIWLHHNYFYRHLRGNVGFISETCLTKERFGLFKEYLGCPEEEKMKLILCVFL